MDNHMVHSALQFAREMEEEEKRKQEELRKENERKRLELKKIAAQEETICLLKQQLVEANKAQDEARQEAMKSKKQSYKERNPSKANEENVWPMPNIQGWTWWTNT